MDRPTYGYSAPDPSGPTDQPVCPRHTDRVAYVRCQRCDRPACPDCQRPAAVGVLCTDCEHEMARSRAAAAPRNAMGARTGSHTPIVTYVLLGLCGVFFLGQMLLPGYVEGLTIFGPYRALAMPWIFLTAGFLHGSLMHVALNGWALWVVGRYLEQTMGAWRFLAVFLVSVLGGHTAVLLLSDPATASWVTHTLGASGGVFGLFGAMFVVNRRLGGDTAQILVLLVLNLVITFAVPGISWQGHLGGLVLGTAMTAAMFMTRPKAVPGADRVALARRAAVIHTGVVAGGVLLCLALIALKVAMVGTGAFATW